MLTFLLSSISKRAIGRILLSILLMAATHTIVAHTYFFGVSELNYNKVTQHIEVIHQLTAHDIENAIAEIQQINFSSEHPKYDELIQKYIEKHFILAQGDKAIKMNWIGFEVKRGQLFAYQESLSKEILTHLMVKNTILVDTYEKQVNTVNYQSSRLENTIQGSLTFDHRHRVAIITSNE